MDSLEKQPSTEQVPLPPSSEQVLAPSALSTELYITPSLSTEQSETSSGAVVEESDDELQENQKLEEEKQMENLKPKSFVPVQEQNEYGVEDNHRPGTCMAAGVQQGGNKICQECLKYVKPLVAEYKKLKIDKQNLIEEKRQLRKQLKAAEKLITVLIERNVSMQDQEMADSNVKSRDGRNETKKLCGNKVRTCIAKEQWEEVGKKYLEIQKTVQKLEGKLEEETSENLSLRRKVEVLEEILKPFTGRLYDNMVRYVQELQLKDGKTPTSNSESNEDDGKNMESCSSPGEGLANLSQGMQFKDALPDQLDGLQIDSRQQDIEDGNNEETGIGGVEDESLCSCPASCGRDNFFNLLKRKEVLCCPRKFNIYLYLQLQIMDGQLRHKLKFDYSKCTSVVKGLRRLKFIDLIYEIKDISEAGGLDQVLETVFKKLGGSDGLLCYETSSYKHCVTVVPRDDKTFYDAQQKRSLSKLNMQQEGITRVQLLKLREKDGDPIIREWLQMCEIDTCYSVCELPCSPSP